MSSRPKFRDYDSILRDACRDQPANFHHLMGPWSGRYEHRPQGVMAVGGDHPWARVWDLDKSTLVTSKAETRLICVAPDDLHILILRQQQ